MSRFYRTPEAALKRAQEKCEQNERVAAVTSLHNLLTSRRVKVWSQTMEDVMMLYIDLCVELKKPRLAKDGLHQYRVVCQQQNAGSMAAVIKHFLECSEKAADQAQEAAAKTLGSSQQIKAETVEAKLLSAVSGEGAKDRLDREHVTPWLKFLWETYKTVLDILRSNQKLESLYHHTARHAFHFCIKYERKTEFRRLSEILRVHLSNITRYPQQLEALVQSEDSLPLRLQTAFAQLNTAAQLELWQEAFRVIEGIRTILMLSRRPPKAQMMAAYYEKLTQVFWVANNHLYHGFCAYKHYLISLAHNKNMSVEERAAMANKVALAVLSIPMKKQMGKHVVKQFDMDVQQEKDLKLAALLGLSVAPTRNFLVSELRDRRIILEARPETRQLFELLEKRFQPLELCAAIKAPLDLVRKDEANAHYLAPLERLVTAKVLKQLEQVYDNMRLEDLAKLTSHVSSEPPEKLIVQAGRNKYVRARIDHQLGVVHFGGLSLESDGVRDHLSHATASLQVAAALLDPSGLQKVRHDEAQKAYARLDKLVASQSEALLARRQLIEKKKEMLEIREKHRVEREELQKAEQAKELRARELAHLKELEEARAAEAKEAQRKALLEAQKTTIVESIKRNKTLEADVVDQLTKKIEEDAIDPRSLLGAQVRIMNERQADLRAKMDTLAVRLDHIERARRRVEKPKLEAQVVADNQQYQDSMSSVRDEQLKKHREAWEAAKAEKERLASVLKFRKDFEDAVTAKRVAKFEADKAAQDARLEPKRNEVRAKREAEIAKLQKEHAAKVEALTARAAEAKDKAKSSTGIDFVPPPSRFKKEGADKPEKPQGTGLDFVPPPSRFKKPAAAASPAGGGGAGARWGDSPSDDAGAGETREVWKPAAKAAPADDGPAGETREVWKPKTAAAAATGGAGAAAPYRPAAARGGNWDNERDSGRAGGGDRSEVYRPSGGRGGERDDVYRPGARSEGGRGGERDDVYRPASRGDGGRGGFNREDSRGGDRDGGRGGFNREDNRGGDRDGGRGGFNREDSRGGDRSEVYRPGQRSGGGGGDRDGGRGGYDRDGGRGRGGDDGETKVWKPAARGGSSTSSGESRPSGGGGGWQQAKK